MVITALFFFTLLLAGKSVNATITDQRVLTGYEDGDIYIFDYSYEYRNKTYKGSGYTTERKYISHKAGDHVGIKLLAAVPNLGQQLTDELEPWVTASYLFCFGLVWSFISLLVISRSGDHVNETFRTTAVGDSTVFSNGPVKE
ncbi:hypothetical protein BH10CYA1_BH10CYA1_11590 [soil metagenome]